MADDVQFVVAENSTYVGKQEIEEKLFARVGTEWDGSWIDVETLRDVVTSPSCKGGIAERIRPPGAQWLFKLCTFGQCSTASSLSRSSMSTQWGCAMS
jgi:hypothetical protein